MDDGRGAIVWARGGLALTECPKSAITAASETLVEEYLVWKRMGQGSFGELSARQVEAFVVLESAMERERHHGERDTRHAVSDIRGTLGRE